MARLQNVDIYVVIGYNFIVFSVRLYGFIHSSIDNSLATALNMDILNFSAFQGCESS